MSESDAKMPAPPPGDKPPGYGNPPMVQRFKTSGNPRGRPKGSRNRKTIVAEVANEMHTVVENGKRQSRSTLELVLLRLRNMALEDKNVRAFKEFHRLIKFRDPQAPVDDNVGYLLAPADISPEEWKRKMVEVAKTARHPSEYKDDDDF